MSCRISGIKIEGRLHSTQQKKKSREGTMYRKRLVSAGKRVKVSTN